MIEPVLKDEALLVDMLAADPGEGFAMWWLGQSGFLIRHRDQHLLFDPYLSDSLTRKYASTDKPHERMTALAIDPAKLSFVGVVTSSHNHTDHLDAETLTPLLAVNPTLKLIIPEANRAFVTERLGIDAAQPLGVDAGQSVTAAGFELHGITAAHEQVDRDEQGRCHFLGYVARFGDWTIYHSGDTLLHDGLVEQLRRFDIDLALLPINGRRPERRVAGNLDGKEAAELAAAIGARMVVPCHFDMFRFNTETPELFTATCRALKQPHRVLRCGERFSSAQL